MTLPPKLERWCRMTALMAGTGVEEVVARLERDGYAVVEGLRRLAGADLDAQGGR